MADNDGPDLEMEVPGEQRAAESVLAVEEKNGGARKRVGRPVIVVGLDELPPLPGDVVRSHRYEKIFRIRATFTVLFSLAVWFAVFLGVAMQVFFTVMQLRHELNFRVQLGVFMIPLLLMVTAVMMDEMLDLGYDAMDLPTFRLFRATLTASMRRFTKAWSTSWTEVGLLVFFELVPLSSACACLVQCDGAWYTRLLGGWILGHLVCGPILSLAYVLAHIHVAHCPLSEVRTAVLWHHMESLGEFKHVAHDVVDMPDKSEKEAWYWKRMVAYALTAVACEALVLVVFNYWKDFAFMFVGQVISTILLGKALSSYAPRLLGKAFWSTLVFFGLLTLMLAFGSRYMIAPDTLAPLAFAPGAAQFGANLTNAGELPLRFMPSSLRSREPGYPLCRTRWGDLNMTSDNQLHVLDLAMMAEASYAPHDLTAPAINDMFNGTLLGEFQIIDNGPDDQVGRWVVVDFPKQNVRVMAVRGTGIVADVYADLEIYSAIVVLQLFSYLFPVLRLLPHTVVQALMTHGPLHAILGDEAMVFLARIEAVAREHKKQAEEKGFHMVLAGHSLGGGIVGVLSTKLAVEGLGISAPGLFYQLKRLDLNVVDMQHSFTEVQPSNDIVPKVDVQRGMIGWIDCSTSAMSCHSLAKTTCELWSQCGDPRGRDFRHTCSQWYSRRDINM